MDISIIIVNYRSKAKLENCLESIKHSDLAGLSVETVVVENASGDDLSDLKDRYVFSLIESGANLGMGGGNNLGISASFGKYILIANPDLVFSADAIRKMYERINGHIEAGLVAPKLLNPDGSLQYSCFRFPKFLMPFARRTSLGKFFSGYLDEYLMKDQGHDHEISVDWVLGACMMVERNGAGFKDNRLFDERFFMYFEDTDLCRRIKDNGKEIIYHPSAVVTHDHVRASAQKPWYQAVVSDRIAREHIKSWLKYFWKWRNIARV